MTVKRKTTTRKKKTTKKKGAKPTNPALYAKVKAEAKRKAAGSVAMAARLPMVAL